MYSEAEIEQIPDLQGPVKLASQRGSGGGGGIISAVTVGGRRALQRLTAAYRVLQTEASASPDSNTRIVRFAERWLILPIRCSHSGKVMVMSQNHRSKAAMLIHTVLICGIAVSSAAIGSEALPPPTGFLFWTPAQQRIGYRNIEKIFPTRIVKRGSNVFPLISNHSNVDVNYRFGSLLLFVVLAALMLATRRLDWATLGREGSGQ
jgi:hypothetical protein